MSGVAGQGAGDGYGGQVRRDSSTGLIRPASSGSATIAYLAPQKASSGGCRPGNRPRSAGGARAAAVTAADAAFSAVLTEQTVLVPRVLPYRPGEFYLRELPAPRAVLAGLPGLALLVIDGYADLDPAGRPGPGAHAHAAFGIPVIGVATTRFGTATHPVQVLRGRSARPLFVTAAGMPPAQAASLVRQMAGPFRLPEALRRADALARTGQQRTTTAEAGTR